MRFIGTLLLLFLFFGTFYAGNVAFENDVKNGELRDIRNVTAVIQWDEINPWQLDNTTIFNKTRVDNIIIKTFDWVGYTMFEVFKGSTEWGYNHGYKYNIQFMFNLLKWALYIIIFSALFIPLIVMGVLIYMFFSWVGRKVKKKEGLTE